MRTSREAHRTSATYASVPHSILYTCDFLLIPQKSHYAFGPSRRIVRRVGTRSHLLARHFLRFCLQLYRRSKKSRPLPAPRADYANITATIIKCIRILIFSSSSSSLGEASDFCIAPTMSSSFPSYPQQMGGRTVCAGRFFPRRRRPCCVCLCNFFHSREPAPTPTSFCAAAGGKKSGGGEKMRSHPPLERGKGGGFANRTVVGNWRVDG